MRITNSMMVQTMIRNLNRNMVRLNDKQIQFSTGKRINRPSDDPLGISKSLRLRTDIAVMDQYKRNVDDAYSFMDNTETALQNMLEGMQRIRELTVQGASATLTQEETSKMQAEIGEIRNQLTDLANYTYSGKNIFTGKKTGEALLDRDGNYLVNLTKATDPRMVDDKWDFEVSTREKIQVNTLGFEVFEAQMREVVYRVPEHDPAANEPAGTWTLSLPRTDGNGNFNLRVVESPLNLDTGSEFYTDNVDFGVTFAADMAPTRLSDGSWAVGADWDGWIQDGDPIINPGDEGFLPGLLKGTFQNIGEIVGPLIGEYRFEVMEPVREAQLINENDPSQGYQLSDPITYLKAIPLNATISDNYASQAAWQVDLVDPLTSADFENGMSPSLTFNGVEIIFERGDAEGDPASLTMQMPPVDKNRVIIRVNGEDAAIDALTATSYAESVTEALGALSEIRGSEVFGFSFSHDGETLQAVAPQNSGTQYNKAYFGGAFTLEPTIPPDPASGLTEREAQLVVTGTSPIRYVEQGQKAGLFAMLDRLEANMLRGQQEDMSNLLGTIDAHINAMLTVRSEVGAKSNRMELIMNRIEDDTLNYRDLMSKIEDADMSKVIIELMNEENVYRSALGVGARIIQPTLLDFLR